MQDGSARRTEKLTSSITPNELAGCPFCPPPIAPELLAPNGRVLSSAANGSLEACVYGLLASTMLYPLLKTKTFDVRQIMRSRSTMVRMRSRNFHSSRC